MQEGEAVCAVEGAQPQESERPGAVGPQTSRPTPSSLSVTWDPNTCPQGSCENSVLSLCNVQNVLAISKVFKQKNIVRIALVKGHTPSLILCVAPVAPKGPPGKPDFQRAGSEPSAEGGAPS